MSEQEQTSSGQSALADDVISQREQLEAQKLTRRSALRKMGITSGIAFGAFFAIDDLAHLVLDKLKQHKETRQIADLVARDFRNAGVAFAGGPSGQQDACSGCIAEKSTQYSRASSTLIACNDSPYNTSPAYGASCVSTYTSSYNSASYQAIACCEQYGCNCGVTGD